jgi:hypothetical protein
MSCYMFPLARVRMFFQNTKLLQAFEKIPSPNLSRKGRGNFPSLDEHCHWIRIMCRPFRAKNIIKSLSQGYRPGLYSVSPSGFALKRKALPINSITLPSMGGAKGGCYIFMIPFQHCLCGERYNRVQGVQVMWGRLTRESRRLPPWQVDAALPLPFQ